jgi:hypothetical protein
MVSGDIICGNVDSAWLPGATVAAICACALLEPSVSSACTIEMPTLPPMLRSRLKIGVPSLRKPRRQRGEGGRRQRHEGEADAQPLDEARHDDQAAVHLQRECVIW